MYKELIKAYFYKFITWDHYFPELLYKSILKTGYKRGGSLMESRLHLDYICFFLFQFYHTSFLTPFVSDWAVAKTLKYKGGFKYHHLSLTTGNFQNKDCISLFFFFRLTEAVHGTTTAIAKILILIFIYNSFKKKNDPILT